MGRHGGRTILIRYSPVQTWVGAVNRTYTRMKTDGVCHFCRRTNFVEWGWTVTARAHGYVQDWAPVCEACGEPRFTVQALARVVGCGDREIGE